VVFRDYILSFLSARNLQGVFAEIDSKGGDMDKRIKGKNKRKGKMI